MLLSWVCLFFMSYPQTELTIKTMDGDLTMSIGLNWWMFTVLLFTIGVAWAFGKASVFKYISDEYPENIGVISGIVGLMGGLGGFVLPIMFGALVDFTGVSSSVFMLLWGVTTVSLIWMYWTEIVPRRSHDGGGGAGTGGIDAGGARPVGQHA
jgi:NNP family nitrate/nitrite transporter-like MFS transporter